VKHVTMAKHCEICEEIFSKFLIMTNEESVSMRAFLNLKLALISYFRPQT